MMIEPTDRIVKPRARWHLARLALLCSTIALMGVSAPGKGKPPIIEVLSSPAEYVSGADARLRINLPGFVPVDRVRMALDGEDVTDHFEAAGDSHVLEGVVDGMAPGDHLFQLGLNIFADFVG